MIRRVRKVLGLQAECGATRVRVAPFSMRGAIQEIPGVKLHARLGGQHFQLSDRS